MTLRRLWHRARVVQGERWDHTSAILWGLARFAGGVKRVKPEMFNPVTQQQKKRAKPVITVGVEIFESLFKKGDAK